MDIAVGSYWHEIVKERAMEMVVTLAVNSLNVRGKIVQIYKTINIEE